MENLTKKWQEVTAVTSVVDLTFLALRVLSLLGGLIWLSLVPLSPAEVSILLRALTLFAIYCSACYLVIFLKPQWLRQIYLVSLFLDLIFLSYLVHSQSYLENSFFIGFYLLVCLHTIYFGLRFGLVVASLSVLSYFACIFENLSHFEWTEIALRMTFLYLIAIPVGLLSDKVKRDKQTVEQLNNELAQSLENLKSIQEKLIESEKFSALGRLTAYIAHEIRNPLTAVGGFARRLEKKLADGSPEKEYTSIIIREVARLEKILLDTLVFGKAGDIKLVRDDLNKPVSAAASLYADLCNEQNITFTQHLSPNLPQVKIDSTQVQQALDSLIINSIHAMPQGGKLTINTGHETKNNTLYLTIHLEDTGKGIDPEIVDFIFEPFYSTKKIGLGTGLGLPIVKKIMDEHRGLLDLVNLPGKGISFTLYFPFQSEEQDMMTPCWEYLKCGIETSPSRHCGAYPYFGRICWSTAGSFSESGVKGICALKIENCEDCSFYKIVNAHLPIFTGDKQSAPA